MTSRPIAFSLIIPAFNEAKRLPRFLKEAIPYLSARFGDKAEILVVDDGSTDGTSLVARELLGPLGVLRFEKNQGKGAAVRSGLLKARGDLCLFADADGATPISEEKKLRSSIAGGAFIAIGSRALGGTNAFLPGLGLPVMTLIKPIATEGYDASALWKVWPHRHVLGRLFSVIVKTLMPLDFKDTQCGFKMFRRQTIHSIFAPLKTTRFSFDVEVLARAMALGYRVDEVGVNWEEKPGSKVSVVPDSLRMFHDLLAIRRLQEWPARTGFSMKLFKTNSS